MSAFQFCKGLQISPQYLYWMVGNLEMGAHLRTNLCYTGWPRSYRKYIQQITHHATSPIQIRKITVQICGNFWVTQYDLFMALMERENTHNSECLPEKIIVSFIRAQHVLSYRLISIPWVSQRYRNNLYQLHRNQIVFWSDSKPAF